MTSLLDEVAHEVGAYLHAPATDLDKSRFRTIDPRDGDAMFVDGGNAAILATSHLEVHLVRVAAVRRGGHRKVVVRE
ncbi:MAG: hypothetical protein ABIH41_05160, partial [Nanoarchaeota archaeon]